jgi:hypothetical protein
MDSNRINEPADDREVARPDYEPPMIIDQGSLTELTLASVGTFTDGGGFGGGGS